MTARTFGRRPLLAGAAGAVLAGAGVAAIRATSAPGRFGADGTLELSGHVQQGMDTLELPVSKARLERVGSSAWRSKPLPATPFTMVGFVWAATSTRSPTVQVRTRRDGQWRPWGPLPTAHARPGSASSDHTGTELVWVGRSDGVQFQVTGGIPSAMKLVLLYPQPLASDRSVPQVGPAGSELPSNLVTGPSSTTEQLRPAILSRAVWGADESWRDPSPRYNHAFQQVHVHHTASSNDYDREDVPAMVRGMYRYHTYNLGWSDIAYNFLVDRFGRVWEGRAGGVTRRVRGAHTLGFNATSAGVAVIGNFDVAPAGRAITDAVASVAAWKLSRWSGDPLGMVRVVSEGSDRFRDGRTVTLPVIDGHRDTNETACPGRNLYAQLPTIRRRARGLMDDAAKTMVKVLEPGSIAGTPQVGETLRAEPGRFDVARPSVTYVWLRDGQVIPGATSSTYEVAASDFRRQLTVQVRAAADGRSPVFQVLAVAGAVAAQPALKVSAEARGWRARVTIKLVPPAGVDAVPAGDVLVRLNEREKVRPLSDGTRTVWFFRLRRGRKTITASYAGGDGFLPARGTTTVDVRG